MMETFIRRWLLTKDYSFFQLTTTYEQHQCACRLALKYYFKKFYFILQALVKLGLCVFISVMCSSNFNQLKIIFFALN